MDRICRTACIPAKLECEVLGESLFYIIVVWIVDERESCDEPSLSNAEVPISPKPFAGPHASGKKDGAAIHRLLTNSGRHDEGTALKRENFGLAVPSAGGDLHTSQLHPKILELSESAARRLPVLLPVTVSPAH